MPVESFGHINRTLTFCSANVHPFLKGGSGDGVIRIKLYIKFGFKPRRKSLSLSLVFSFSFIFFFRMLANAPCTARIATNSLYKVAHVRLKSNIKNQFICFLKVYIIHLLTGYEGNSTFIVLKVPAFSWGNTEENRCRGDNKSVVTRISSPYKY